MDINLLKYLAFVKTVENGSFTRAADVLHYSQSGVSRMIRDLESEWDVTLLERSRAGVALTSDGSRLLPLAKGLCDQYRRLQTEVDDLHGIQSGLIRIGVFSSVATHWLPNIIRAFQQDYPGIDYELLLGDYTEIETWIAQGRVDCGFLRLPTIPPSRLSLWRRTACWPSCRRATRWRRRNGSPCPPCVRSRSSCWKRAPVRRYRISSSAAA